MKQSEGIKKCVINSHLSNLVKIIDTYCPSLQRFIYRDCPYRLILLNNIQHDKIIIFIIE